MGPREAAYACRFSASNTSYRCTTQTFPMLTGTPEAFRHETRDIPGFTVHALNPGESL